MLALLARRPHFRRLYLAGAISLVGDWLSLVAVSLLAVQGDGGAASLALIFAAHALPSALGSTLAGPVADRFDRRRVLLAAQLAQGALTVLMVLAAARGAVGVLSLLVLARSATASLVAPAETAAVRRVVEPGELVQANALLAATWSVAFVVGMALGGVLAMLGPVIAIALDAASFVAAALLVRGLPALPVDRSGDEAPGKSALFAAPADMLAAVRHALAEPALLRAVLAKVPLGLAGGAAWIALNLLASSAHPFGTAALSLGILQAVRGAGTGIGPLAAHALTTRGASPSLLGHLAAAASLGGMALTVHAAHATPLVLASLCWGIGVGTNWVLSYAAVQRLAPDAMVGRLVALDELLATGTMVASALAGGALMSRGTSATTVVTSLTLAGAVAWTGLSLRGATAATVAQGAAQE